MLDSGMAARHLKHEIVTRAVKEELFGNKMAAHLEDESGGVGF